MIAEVLVDRTVRTVAWRRSVQAARVAAAQVENLQLALATSRSIGAAVGIVMSTYKTTPDQAFTLLIRVSQHTHRKLREIADEVIETGWIDPELVPAG